MADKDIPHSSLCFHWRTLGEEGRCQTLMLLVILDDGTDIFRHRIVRRDSRASRGPAVRVTHIVDPFTSSDPRLQQRSGQRSPPSPSGGRSATSSRT